eukprot:5624151-Amphidinium_carterae.1
MLKLGAEGGLSCTCDVWKPVTSSYLLGKLFTSSPGGDSTLLPTLKLHARWSGRGHLAMPL